MFSFSRATFNPGNQVKYVIWSYRKRMWWGVDRSGYTRDVAVAGRYYRAEAASVMFDGLPGANIAIDLELAARFTGMEESGLIEAEIESWRRI
jgi:hypothetical protein